MTSSSILYLPGTHLEGGGQLLRNAVCLSALLHKPIEIESIRGNRKDGGGLKSQHLVGLLWLANASGARVEGAVKGGKNVAFYPGDSRPFWKTFALKEANNKTEKGKKRGKKYFLGEGEQNVVGETDGSDLGHVVRQVKIDIGTPGSVFLVFQAILPFIAFSSAKFLPAATEANISNVISLTISGGTNTTLSPSYEYTSQVFLPTLIKHVRLPGITMKLDKRCWAFGNPESQEIGSVTFEIEVLRIGEGIKGFAMEKGKKDKESERICKVTATIIVPTEADLHTFEEVARNMIGDVEWNGENDKEVEVEISTLSEATSSGIGSETGSGTDRNFHVLLHATTSPSGYLLGYEYLYTAPSDKKKGKKPHHKMPPVKELRGKASSKEILAQNMISKPLEKLLRRWKHGNITDEYLQDQLVIWQALASGWSFVEATDGGEEYGASSPADGKSEEQVEIGSLHTRTARWVAERIAGVKWEGKGKGGCYGIGLKAGDSGRVICGMLKN